ncbi:MAG: hypothetical protein V4608_14050 [Bacteroidota bacterium]
MKKIKYLAFFLFCAYTLSSFINVYGGEKIIHNTKTGEVHKGDEVLFYMDVKNYAFGLGDYSVKNLAKKELFYVKHEHYTTSTSAVPAGQIDPNKVSYFKILFFNNNKTVEIPITTNGNLARSFIKDGLIVNGDLDTLAQARYILINGNEYSKTRYGSNNNNGNTIIINTPPPANSNGFNLHIQH